MKTEQIGLRISKELIEEIDNRAKSYNLDRMTVLKMALAKGMKLI